MSLRDLAESDLAVILEDENVSFAQSITITNPAGTSNALFGTAELIHQTTDPDAGQIVSNLMASVDVRQTTFNTLFPGETAVAIADKNSKPWVVEWVTTAGTAHKFRVVESNPDDTLSVLTLLLGKYESP